MEKTKLTIDEIAEINPEAMLADGFDDAIMGMCIPVSYTHLTLPTTPYV